MEVSYKKLWKLLIDRDMKKMDLREITGISSSTMAKLGKGEFVSQETINRICSALGCDIGDVMEFVDNDSVSR